MKTPQKQFIQKDWEERGFNFSVWTDPPGQCWEDYVHTVDELFMLIEGQIELEIQGRTMHPSVGEEILIPAHATHSVRNIGSTTNKWFYGYRRT